MMKKRLGSIVMYAGGAGILMVVVVLSMFAGGVRSMPHCQEDQVLLGVGDFEDGYWDSYECGPAADDFAPFSDTQLQACGEAWYHTMAALDEALVRLGNE